LDYISVKHAAEKWEVTERAVQLMCNKGIIKGAVRLANVWAIPKDAERPADKRYKINKKEHHEK